MSSVVRRGQCLCGGVTVALSESLTAVGACHCATCRRWCSGPWMAIQAPEAEIAGVTLRVFASSDFAERGFCLECGSHVFHRPKDGPELAISAGLFEPGGLRLAEEIFHDRKPSFYRFGDDTRKKGSWAMAAVWGPRILWRRAMRMLDRIA